MSSQSSSRHILGSLLTILLLGIYLSADLVGSLHSYFVHEEQSETVCTLENEKDACHRTIYHHDKERGCSHPTHITKPMVKCELCNMLLRQHVMPSKKASDTSFVNHVPVVPFLEDRLVSNPACSAHGLRGPPLFS